MSIHICDKNGHFITSYHITDKSLKIHHDEYIFKKTILKKITFSDINKDINDVLHKYPFSVWEKQANTIEIICFWSANKWKYID